MFQFLIVRLKYSAKNVPRWITSVSIPYSTIKISTACISPGNSFVSIPYSTIKIKIRHDNAAGNVVSIPYSTIKMFMEHCLLLSMEVSIPYSTIKIAPHHLPLLHRIVSIPYSTIKIRICWWSQTAPLWFQFLIVRLKYRLLILRNKFPRCFNSL